MVELRNFSSSNSARAASVSIQVGIFSINMIIYVGRWWETYLLKWSLTSYIFSWCHELIILRILNTHTKLLLHIKKLEFILWKFVNVFRKYAYLEVKEILIAFWEVRQNTHCKLNKMPDFQQHAQILFRQKKLTM